LKDDLYTVPDHTTETGTIQQVTVYAVGRKLMVLMTQNCLYQLGHLLIPVGGLKI